MIIYGASVKKSSAGVWHPWFLLIRCDVTPTHDVYDVKDHLYFSEKNGFCSFHAYKQPDRGFGGVTFRTPVRQPDGSVKIEDHIGPWSSNAAYASKLFKPCLHVNVHTDQFSNLSGTVTTEFAKMLLTTHKLPFKVRCLTYKKDIPSNDWRIFPEHYEEGRKFQGSYYVGKEA